MLDVSRVAHSNRKTLSGTPVFTGTRVPVRIFFEFLAAGDKLDEFLDAYPSVSRAQAVSLLEVAAQIVTDAERRRS